MLRPRLIKVPGQDPRRPATAAREQTQRFPHARRVGNFCVCSRTGRGPAACLVAQLRQLEALSSSRSLASTASTSLSRVDQEQTKRTIGSARSG